MKSFQKFQYSQNLSQKLHLVNLYCATRPTTTMCAFRRDQTNDAVSLYYSLSATVKPLFRTYKFV